MISPIILFEYGLLKKLVITDRKEMQILTQFPWKLKHIINSMMESHPQHFMVLEIMNILPSYQDYPIQAQHYIKIDLVHYGKPRIYKWNKSLFTAHHIDIPTKDKPKRWRAYALGIAPKKFQTCYLIGE